MRYLGKLTWPYRNSIIEKIFHRDWGQAKRLLGFWWEWLRNGYSQDEIWSLDTTIAQFCLPRMRDFRRIEEQITPPGKDKEEWLKVLDKIIEALRLVAETDCGWKWDKFQSQVVDEGMALFGKYFGSFWY